MPASTLLRRPAVVLVLGLCAIAAITTALGRLTSGPAAETAPITLPDTSGAVAFTAFSPDGNRIAYSQRGESKDDGFHVFVRRVPTGAPQQLTDGPANDLSPAWSPDGATIAFVRLGEGVSQCIAVPAAGGAERKIADVPPANSTQFQPRLAWLHDGKSLAVVTGAENQPAAIALLNVASGEIHRITTPPDGGDGDWSPAISPDGATLAFSRGAGEGADLYVSDPTGANLRRVTFEGHPIHGIAWMPDSAGLIYATQLGGGVKLWRIAVNGGSPRDLFLNARMAAFPAVSAAHNRLAFTETPTTASVWRAPLDSPGAIGKPLLRSSGREFNASYSPDGKHIADISDQSGAEEIWISDADGNNRVQITNFKGPEPGRPLWSPDGKWLLFDMKSNSGGGGAEKVLAAPGAQPVRVLTGGQGASWSHDGKWIYFEQRGGIWKAAADGSNPESLTERPGSGAPAESPDGKFVYYRNRRGIWRIPSAGGEEEAVLEPEFGIFGGRPQVSAKGIYYQGFDRGDRAAVISFYDFATKRSSVVFRIRMTDSNVPVSFSASPDGKFVLYPMVDRSQTTLKLVENFK